MIAIIDVGLCNAGSIANMLRIIGAEAERTAAPDVVQRASRLILPGIGSFDEGRKRLEASGLLPLLEHRVRRERIPILGICLGMQLMTRASEEGQLPGLGWIDGVTQRFSFPPGGAQLRVPHMGWNDVVFRPESPLAKDMPADPRFYFVHSYHVVLTDDDAMALCHTTYGYRFASGFSVGNVHGVQFHPEKSHKYGLQFLRNFAALPAP
jgi:glutamine amidotransferase